jgi:hypothetical protein
LVTSSGAGDRVERLARLHRSPDHGHARSRVDPAVEQRRHVDDDPAKRVHEIRRQVRPGRVPAGAGERDVDRVGGCGERSGAHAHQAGGQLRVAVQRVDGGDVLECAGRDHPRRAGRHAFLGRLEDQPDPAGQFVLGVELGQRQPEAEQYCGVHVVAAGVRHIHDRGAVRDVLGVLQRQRVQVGPERDDPLALADVADDAVALRQQLRGQSGDGQFAGDERGCLELREGQLRVRVEVPTDGYQLGSAGGEPAVELAGQRVGAGRWARPGRHRGAIWHLGQSSGHV